jgi:hypothetical protein
LQSWVVSLRDNHLGGESARSHDRLDIGRTQKADDDGRLMGCKAPAQRPDTPDRCEVEAQYELRREKTDYRVTPELN